MNLKIIPLPYRTVELIDALRLHMGRMQIQPGCVQCRISQDSEEKNIILYQEEWKTWEDLDKHICSERFSWILELMEQSRDVPDLIFCDVHETRGMEYIRKLRKVN